MSLIWALSLVFINVSAFVGALCVQSHLSGALPGLGLSQRAQGFLQWCSHTRTRWFLSTACTISCQVHNTAHTHTHTSTETNTSKHRYVVTYHMGRARGARFQGLSHRKWETRSEFSSSFQTNDPCSIVEHSPFPIMLTFATKVFTSLMKLLPLSQGITYLCISAADHSKQNLWVLE